MIRPIDDGPKDWRLSLIHGLTDTLEIRIKGHVTPCFMRFEELEIIHKTIQFIHMICNAAVYNWETPEEIREEYRVWKGAVTTLSKQIDLDFRKQFFAKSYIPAIHQNHEAGVIFKWAFALIHDLTLVLRAIVFRPRESRHISLSELQIMHKTIQLIRLISVFEPKNATVKSIQEGYHRWRTSIPSLIHTLDANQKYHLMMHLKDFPEL